MVGCFILLGFMRSRSIPDYLALKGTAHAVMQLDIELLLSHVRLLVSTCMHVQIATEFRKGVLILGRWSNMRL